VIAYALAFVGGIIMAVSERERVFVCVLVRECECVCVCEYV